MPNCDRCHLPVGVFGTDSHPAEGPKCECRPETTPSSMEALLAKVREWRGVSPGWPLADAFVAALALIVAGDEWADDPCNSGLATKTRDAKRTLHALVGELLGGE